jgi:DDE superfamily endonuclease
MPRGPVGGRVFPPEAITLVKAIACERLPAPGAAPPPAAAPPAAPVSPPPRARAAVALREVPLARLSVGDVLGKAWDAGLEISYSSVWRILHQEALRPWFQKQWLFPRDPLLLEKASPILGLYQRCWGEEPLSARDVVLCGDELTRLQALTRPYGGTPPAPGREARYEFTHERSVATLCYLAFLDVGSGRVYGETHPATGIQAFEATLGHCLADRYPDAERVFLIVDNGSAHHPATSPARIQTQFPQVTVVHLPVHSSWLNQIEIYFSILKRKALTPADFADVEQVGRRIAGFERYYNRWAEPFRWRYTREKLAAYLKRLGQHDPVYARHAWDDSADGDAPREMPHPLTIH